VILRRRRGDRRADALKVEAWPRRVLGEAFGQPGCFGSGDLADERAERGNGENSLSVMSSRVRAREQQGLSDRPATKAWPPRGLVVRAISCSPPLPCLVVIPRARGRSARRSSQSRRSAQGRVTYCIRAKEGAVNPFAVFGFNEPDHLDALRGVHGQHQQAEKRRAPRCSNADASEPARISFDSSKQVFLCEAGRAAWLSHNLPLTVSEPNRT
jgi:hypothetical protein